MKKLILLFCMSLILLGAYPQKENSMDGKITKELRKEQKKAEVEAAAKSVDRMVTNHQFYLEINFMSDQSRAFSQSTGLIDVRSQMNYIAIDSNKIIMQLVPNTYLTTNWGIGSLPLRGTFLGYKLSKSEKSDGGYFIHFRTTGEIGNWDIYMKVSPSGMTDLRIAGNNGQTLNFRGVLIPLDQSRIALNLL